MKKKIGFVASGGAAKAACFHMGVAMALERKGFRFRRGLKKDAEPPSNTGRDINVLVGSSAGAFASALLISGHEVEEIYNSFRGIHVRSMPRLSYFDMLHPNWYDTIKHFLTRLPKSLAMRGNSFEALVQGLFCSNGFCTTEKIEQYLRNEILPSNSFADYAADLYMVTTLLDNPGRAIMGPRKLKPSDEQISYHTDVGLSDAAAASMALPPIFKPHTLTSEGQTFHCFDGEIRNTLSTHIAKDAGCDLIVASYTHQPYHYREEIGSLLDFGIPSILLQAIYQLIESKIMRSKQLHDMKKTVLDTVIEFFDIHDLPQDLKNKMLLKLEEKMEFNRELDYIFISPSPHEENLFFEDHFNLSPSVMAKIAEQGFMSAIRVLKDYEFAFLESEPLPQAQVVGF